jgi:hypothetical protein
MKRCGQWFSLLWVTGALLWPQPSTTQVTRSPAGISANWAESQVESLALLSDFSGPDTAKGEELSMGDPNEPDPMFLESAFQHTSPVCLVSGTIVLLSERAVFRVPIGLPFSRGPPEHS